MRPHEPGVVDSTSVFGLFFRGRMVSVRWPTGLEVACIDSLVKSSRTELAVELVFVVMVETRCWSAKFCDRDLAVLQKLGDVPPDNLVVVLEVGTVT